MHAIIKLDEIADRALDLDFERAACWQGQTNQVNSFNRLVAIPI